MSKHLDFIKRNATHNELTNFNTGRVKRVVTIPEKNYEWLIEQAERVKELEGYKESYEGVVRALDNMSETLLKEEQQNKRYRKALEEIRDRGTYELNNAMKTDYAWIADKVLECEE